MLAPSVYLRGYESFSEVTGGTALSFRGLSVGETAGPACGTMRSPAYISGTQISR